MQNFTLFFYISSLFNFFKVCVVLAIIIILIINLSDYNLFPKLRSSYINNAICQQIILTVFHYARETYLHKKEEKNIQK